MKKLMFILLIVIAFGAPKAEATVTIFDLTHAISQSNLNPYAQEGDWVNAPAYGLSTLLWIPGAIITLPFCATYGLFAGDDLSGIGCNSFISSYWTLHTVFGFPLYVIKKVVWDVPAHFYSVLTTSKTEVKESASAEANDKEQP